MTDKFMELLERMVEQGYVTKKWDTKLKCYVYGRTEKGKELQRELARELEPS